MERCSGEHQTAFLDEELIQDYFEPLFEGFVNCKDTNEEH